MTPSDPRKPHPYDSLGALVHALDAVHSFHEGRDAREVLAALRYASRQVNDVKFEQWDSVTLNSGT